MLHHNIKVALAVLAALLLAHGTARAQSTFGHFGDFSSAQGAPAPFTTTAPGMYASGQYLTAGPFNFPMDNMNQPGPYSTRTVIDTGRSVYFPLTQANAYRPNAGQPYGGNNTYRNDQSNPYRAYAPGAAGSAAPRPVYPYGANRAAQDRWINDLSRYHYERGFEAGYNAGLSGTRPVPTHPYGPAWFGEY
jgi:hypothetical protein